MDQLITTEILIVGAGPTGLSLACQLVRYGIDFVIVERNEGITPYSKAIGVQARTLEIYEQIDLAQRAVEEGTIAGKGRLIVGGEVRGELEVSRLGEGLSPYPFVLMLEQSKNENLLYEYLRSHDKDVRWRTELKSFSQNDAGVTAQVETGDGVGQTIAAKYLVGCDGPKSLVRHNLGLLFEGSTFERVFYVADAQIDWNFSHDAVHICLSPDSFVVFFPLKGEKRYRIVGVFPEEFAKDEGDILYEEIEARIKEEAKLELEIHDVEWFSTYKVHTRHVSKFSEGRCFLAGDAAHIHSPAGAQGMNTGIQDSYNLAWKIALVLRGKTNEKLLETYNEERLANAKHLLKTTDRIFELVAGSEWIVSFVRMHIFPPLAKYVLSIETVKKKLFPLLSQIGIHYRESSLSAHGGDEEFRVKAGDRMPYVLVDGQSLYESLRHPKFHCVIFSNAADDLQAMKSELENEFIDLIDFNIVPLDPNLTDVFGNDKGFSLLLRPDNYIGLISTESATDEIRNYLKVHMGLRSESKPRVV
jgi:2-polyprenyl-6-methoxyphenol hydroxylase-like FAD-dependent oxidoreductase